MCIRDSLLASGGLLPVDLTSAEGAPDGAPVAREAGIPALPVALGAGRPGLRRQPPRAGEHGIEVLQEAGLSETEINTMITDGIVSVPAQQSPVAA